jgi:hypothetical protein
VKKDRLVVIKPYFRNYEKSTLDQIRAAQTKAQSEIEKILEDLIEETQASRIATELIIEQSPIKNFIVAFQIKLGY